MNEYSLRDGKEFAEELRKRKESFLNNKSSKYYNKFSKLCDSIPISVQTINSAIDTPNAKPDEPGRKKLKEYTLYGYYAAWYLLGHVEEKAAKPDDIKIFSKYFMDNDADRVEKFLEEIFHNSQSQAGDFPVNSTTQPAKNVEPEKKDGMSKKQDMNNVILPEKMQWACDWWDRYKTRGTTAYQLEPMVKEKYI